MIMDLFQTIKVHKKIIDPTGFRQRVTLKSLRPLMYRNSSALQKANKHDMIDRAFSG